MRQWLVVVGLWLAKLGGWTPPPPVVVREPFSPSAFGLDYAAFSRALEIVESLNVKYPAHIPGELKRKEALAMLLTSRQGISTRDAALCIELAIRRHQWQRA